MDTTTSKRRLLTLTDVEEEFGIGINTQRFWRHKGTGPRSFKIGRKVVYERADLEIWLAQQRAAV